MEESPDFLPSSDQQKNARGIRCQVNVRLALFATCRELWVFSRNKNNQILGIWQGETGTQNVFAASHLR